MNTMPNPTLLERVEAASGPDRELDADLCLRWQTPNEHYREPLRRPILMAREHQRPGLLENVEISGVSVYSAPQYTASLDAVLALVERVLPGGLWMVASADPPIRLPARVELWTGDEEVCASAATPALALLAALLKATPERSDV